MRASFFRLASLTLLVVGALSLLTAWHTTYERPNDERTAYELMFAPDLARFRIDFGSAGSELDGRSSGDVQEQLRDWSVVGTLLRARVDLDALRLSTWRSAAVRRPYLEDSFLFEYGRGRSAILDEDHVLLFYEKQDRDQQATLARTAETVRQRTGQIPAHFLLFETEFDLPNGRVLVERKSEVPGATLFGEAYGYVERPVRTLTDFRSWLAAIDDVTLAEHRDGVLVLGGRRHERSRTANVDDEDVAVLVHGQQELAAAADAHERAVSAIEADVERRYRETLLRGRNEAYQMTQHLLRPDGPGRSKSKADFQRELEERVGELEPGTADLGFSLDPQWRLDELVPSLQRYAQAPCAVAEDARLVLSQAQAQDELAPSLLVATSQPFAQLERRLMCELVRENRELLGEAAQALSNIKQVPRAKREDRIALALAPFYRDDPSGFRDALTEFLTARHGMQCARYDGPLQGTRVGMNLFYTDLLAKLWLGLDYHGSAPVAAVPGFISLPRAAVEPFWNRESRELRYTRLWFGPKRESYVSTEAGLLFAPIIARVYAAGSDPGHPGVEKQPAEPSRRALGWWDRHFQDVADYEQEYHRQNQIFKWSLISARFASELSFLSSIEPRRDYVFDSWLQENQAALRYRHPVALRERSEWVSGTECLDRLLSYDGPGGTISGGVTLAGKRTLAEASYLNRELPAALRQSLAQSSPSANGAVGSALRTAPSFSEGTTTATLTATTRARSAGAELRVAAFTESARRLDARTVSIGINADDKAVGALVVRLDRDGVQLSIEHGPVDRAMRLGSRASSDAMPVALEGEGPLYLTRDGASALQRTMVTAGEEVPGELVRAGRSRLFSMEEAIQLQDADTVASKLASHEWQQLTAGGGFGGAPPPGITRRFSNTPPPPDARPVQLRAASSAEPLEAFVDGRGAVYVRKPAHADELKAWLYLEQETGLSAQDLPGIAGRARESNGAVAVVDLAELHPPSVLRAERALQAGQYEDALGLLAAELSRDGAGGMAQALSQRTLSRARSLARGGDGVEAGQLFRDYEATFGPLSAEDSLQAAVAELHAGHPASALRRIQDRDAFATLMEGELLDPQTRHLGQWARARSNADRTFFQRSALELELGAWDRELVSVLRIDRPLRGRMLSASERAAVGPGDAVYLDDGFSLNRHDLEVGGSGVVADFRKLPHVKFEEVEAAGDAAYAPLTIVDSTQQEFRLASSPATRAPRLIRVRSCDTDGDGQLSELEREACAG